MGKTKSNIWGKLFDPAGVHRQHTREETTDMMKQTAFKMKGYTYPGASPIKDIKPIKVISKKVLDANLLEKSKWDKRIKRKENWGKFKEKVKSAAESPVGQDVIASTISSITTPKPKKDPTRIVSEKWGSIGIVDNSSKRA